MHKAAQTAAGQPEIKSQTLADIGAAERLICASRLPWAWRPPPPISAARRVFSLTCRVAQRAAEIVAWTF